MLTDIASYAGQWLLFIGLLKALETKSYDQFEPMGSEEFPPIEDDRNRACKAVRDLCTTDTLNKILDEEPALLYKEDSDGYSLLDRVFLLNAESYATEINQYLTSIFSRGIDLNIARRGDYRKGIHLAVGNNNIIAVKRMLQAFPDLLHYSLICGGTAAHMAARFANAQVMREIINIHARVYGRNTHMKLDYQNRHPLHIAAREGRISIIKELVIGQNTSFHRDRFGHSPIGYAKKYKHIQVREFLSLHCRVFSENIPPTASLRTIQEDRDSDDEREYTHNHRPDHGFTTTTSVVTSSTT